MTGVRYNQDCNAIPDIEVLEAVCQVMCCKGGFIPANSGWGFERQALSAERMVR